MTPKFEVGRDFCTVHLPAKFYVYSFGSHRVDKQTNKQTDVAENIQRFSLCYDVGQRDYPVIIIVVFIVVK